MCRLTLPIVCVVSVIVFLMIYWAKTSRNYITQDTPAITGTAVEEMNRHKGQYGNQSPKNTGNRIGFTESFARFDSPNKPAIDNGGTHSQSLLESSALDHPSPTIMAAALGELKDIAIAHPLLIRAMSNQSEIVRDAALKKSIDLEETDNRVFHNEVTRLLDSETDSNVLETALSYFSLTIADDTYEKAQKVLAKSTLSASTIAYVGEVLFEDCHLEKQTVINMLATSPSYQVLDKSGVVRLLSSLRDVFEYQSSDD